MLLLPKVAPVLAPMVCHAPRLARCSGEDACSDARVREHAEIHRIEQGAGGRVLDGGLGCLLIRRASPPSRAQVPAHGSPVIDARGSMCTATVVSCQSRTLLFARCCCCRCRCCRSCRSCRHRHRRRCRRHRLCRQDAPPRESLESGELILRASPASLGAPTARCAMHALL